MAISSAPRAIRPGRPSPQLVGRRSLMPSPTNTSLSMMYATLGEAVSLTPSLVSAVDLGWPRLSLVMRKIVPLWLAVRVVEGARSAHRMTIWKGLASPSTFSQSWRRVRRSRPFLFMGETWFSERRRAISFCSRCQTHRQRYQPQYSFPMPMKEPRSSHLSIIHPKSVWKLISYVWGHRTA